MKPFLVLLSMASGFTLMAQSTNAPMGIIKAPVISIAAIAATNTAAPETSPSLQAEISSRNQPILTLKPIKPNEIVKRGISYSGIAVEGVKKRNLFQLINPLAPPQYGSPEDNVVRDPINGRVEGLRIFAFRF